MLPRAKWAAAAALALLVGSAAAADHRDGPAAKGDPSSDLDDLYGWTNPGRDKLYLAMSLGGTSAPLSFTSAVLYVFHLNRDADPLSAPDKGTNTDVVCRFTKATSVECWLGSKDYVKGDPSGPLGVTSASKVLQVHAGRHADPFFFFLGGLNKAIDAVQKASGLAAYASGCPKLDAATVASLQGLLTGGAGDDFAGNNALVLLVAVKKDAIPGVGENFSVWASTNAVGK